MNTHDEYGKGYIALRILVLLGYLGAFAYTIFGICLALKAAPAVFMVIGGIMSLLGVYVLDRVAKAVFIIRDHLTGPGRP